MTSAHGNGALVRSRPCDVADVRRLRQAAEARYSEVDLLVAALKDHIRDLQAERDHLRAQLTAAREAARLGTATWLHRGLKAPH